MKHLILVSGSVPTVQDQRILAFAAWMGVQTKTIVIAAGSDPTQQLFDESGNSRSCLAMSMETLTAVHKASPQPADLCHFLEEHSTELLVFGCSDSSRHGTTLSWLTKGVVRGVTSPEVTGDKPDLFHLPQSCRAFSQQFAGLSFFARRGVSLQVFDINVTASAVQAIMQANDRPLFICMNRVSYQLFLLAGSEIPDINQPLSRGKGIEEYYNQIIPLLILFRYCFGQHQWHGPESTARLIIDDPVLADRYGFLDYHSLLGSIHRERYGASIAFIPWNYRRTSQRTALRLLGKEASVSICVHGCDHTNLEFDLLDQEALIRKAGLALERMERHQERTRLPFERVMVFPQGRFSTNALFALRATNYLAAVNSTCFPTDDGPEPLRIADFLRPAVTRFHGFPIFHRRYPQHLIDFAFDIFLGKPALLVEHHQYFRDGCKKLEEFVGELRKVEPKLYWPTLSSQLTRSCMMKRISDDLVEVQFFTRRFQLDNTQASSCRFVLEKHEPDSSAIAAVFVDGSRVPFWFKESLIQLEVELGPGQKKDIEILDHARPVTPARRSGLTYSFGVLLRRGLSEFRDNTLARHPGLLRAATGVARGLKVTGDRQTESES